jgi:hypothetical protein
MNSQLKEVLVYQGKALAMACEPLNQYFSQMVSPPQFYSLFEANARGYLGKWAIIRNELFITDFIGVLENRKEISLQYFFPGKQIVFAEWFNGEIVLTHGKLLTLKSPESPALYEKDLHLEFLHGRLINTYLVENKVDQMSIYNSDTHYSLGLSK